MEIELKKCHYCESHSKDDNYNYEHTLYEIIKSHPIKGLGYSYREKKIKVPRCKSCFSKHSKSFTYFSLPIFLIVLFVFVRLFMHWWDLESFEWLLLLPSSIFSLLITYALSTIFNEIYFNRIWKIKHLTDIKDIPEIETLLSLGWKFDKPAKGEYITNEDLSDTSPYKK